MCKYFTFHNSMKSKCPQQEHKCFSLKSNNSLVKIRGFDTITLNPGDFSKSSVIVYVWIGPRGAHWHLSFFSWDICAGIRLSKGLLHQQRTREKKKQALRREQGRQRDKRRVYVKYLKVGSKMQKGKRRFSCTLNLLLYFFLRASPSLVSERKRWDENFE